MSRGLEHELRSRGVVWPAPIEHHERLGSTSDRLKALAREGAPAWTVVLADEQTAGRGRQGRAWSSPRGGLYVSVLLRPTSQAVGLVPLAAGVAVAEALEGFGVRARLKWPNDVLVDGGKLAGILAEASSGASAIEWIVLGVGVNLEPVGLADDLWATAAALGARGAGRDAVAAAVLRQLRVWYDALTEREAAVLEAWRERSVPWWGEPVEVMAGERVLRGHAHGLDERGGLVLDLEDGSRVSVLAGEARALRLATSPEGQR
jgi:BirA family biotin operon repressor/biotin-[acetyl-CoA-carboxylase] ligase